MPDPVIIDEVTQSFEGRIYRKRSDNGYYQCGGYPLLLHREVWRVNTGAVPAGKRWNVHHEDENKANNAFANLRLLTSKEHAEEHLTPERRAASRAHMLANVIPAARAWHSSPEGIEWHRQHGREVWEAVQRRPMRQFACAVCGIMVASHKARAKFCGPNCRAADLRSRRAAGAAPDPARNGLANVAPTPHVCVDCGGEYLTKSGRALRCPPCRDAATNARARAAYAAR